MSWLCPPLDLRGVSIGAGARPCAPPCAAPGWASGARETGAGGAGDGLDAEPMIWTWGGVWRLAARAISAHTSPILLSTLLCFACISTIPLWTIPRMFCISWSFCDRKSFRAWSFKNFSFKSFFRVWTCPNAVPPHIPSGVHGSASRWRP